MWNETCLILILIFQCLYPLKQAKIVVKCEIKMRPAPPHFPWYLDTDLNSKLCCPNPCSPSSSAWSPLEAYPTYYSSTFILGNQWAPYNRSLVVYLKLFFFSRILVNSELLSSLLGLWKGLNFCTCMSRNIVIEYNILPANIGNFNFSSSFYHEERYN